VIRRSCILALAATTSILTGLPAPVAAHGLVGRLDASLPLEVYLAGAAIAVALSFTIAFAYSGRWQAAPSPPIRRVPRPVVLLLRCVGLLAWTWIVAQFVVGGSSDAEVGSLFTWVYGWVGLAIVSAFLGPVWEWLDPFATLHDIGALVLRRLGIGGRPPALYPDRLAAWPAVVGFAMFVWLELAYQDADMDAVVVAYTIVALAGMAWFGRDRWRGGGEVFTVWFGVLNRVARYVLAGPPSSGLVKRQRFPDGLLGRPWDASLVALVAIATGAILYDGLSQTQLFFDVFGLPGLAESTLLLAGFLATIVALVLLVGRRVGMVAMGASLVPISIGYLIAHYLTYLLGEGQRIVVAASDPLQQGWDLFGTAFLEPSMAWLPSSIVWSIMFLAVVGGHVLGAWAGHLRTTPGSRSDAQRRRAQLPLAGVMVALTTLTLWSLGQVVFRPEPSDATGVVPTASGAPAPAATDRPSL
jgi:hypothetical protein